MFENIPQQLKEMNQWVCYQAIPKGERITKVPVNPSNGKAIDVNNKENWLTFNEAVYEIKQGNNRISGIGFVFSDHDPFIGIDLDDCINEKVSFPLWQMKLCKALRTRHISNILQVGGNSRYCNWKSRMVLPKMLIMVLKCMIINAISL